jgi:hypothetical protein
MGKNSLLIGLAWVMVLLILATFPLWRYQPEKPEPEPTSERETASPRSSFRYRNPTSPSSQPDIDLDPSPSVEKIRRQLDRHAQRKQNGFYDRVVDNPEMPAEIRDRFQAEKNRLEDLEESNPAIAAEVSSALLPPPVNPDGSFSPEFQEVVALMKTYGVWDDMVDNHVEQLMRDAEDSDLPPESRPSQEEIEAVRKQGLIPAL